MFDTVTEVQEVVEDSHLSNESISEGSKAYFLVDCGGVLCVPN